MPSILKASVHISACVDGKFTSKFRIPKQSLKQITLPIIYKINIKSVLDISHYTSFPSLINTYINGKKEKINVEIVTEIPTILSNINKQENLLHATNESNEQEYKVVVPDVKVDKCTATSCLACFSAPVKVFVKAPVISVFVIVAPGRICGKGYCNKREYYFEGRCDILHRLQQEGESNFTSTDLVYREIIHSE
jgi:hypothetical protein